MVGLDGGPSTGFLFSEVLGLAVVILVVRSTFAWPGRRYLTACYVPRTTKYLIYPIPLVIGALEIFPRCHLQPTSKDGYQ